MNDREPHETILPAPEHTEPALVADELLSHGLLTFSRHDTAAETERRVRAVMRRIADEHPAHGRTLRFPMVRRWGTLAACLLVCAGLVYLGMPTSGTAQAMVLASAASLREPGDRRFEVRVRSREAREFPAAAAGTIDARHGGTEALVTRLQPEEGVWLTFGRDAQGTWMVTPDGRVERNPPAMLLPRMGMGGEQPVLPESVDRVLDDLAHAYTLERTTEKGDEGTPIEHIVGVRRPDRPPGVPRVEVWIDPATKGVKKVELVMPDGPPPPPGRGGGPGHHHDDGPGPDFGPGRDGPRDRRPPPPGELGRDDDPHDGPGELRGPGPRGGKGNGPMGRGARFNPGRIELRQVAPPPLPPEWFTPEHHARKSPPPERHPEPSDR